MFFLSLAACYSISTERTKLETFLGRKLYFSDKKLLSSEGNCWFFVRFNENVDLIMGQLANHSISLDTSNAVQSNLFHLFLSSAQINYLLENDYAKIAKVTPKSKFLAGFDIKSDSFRFIADSSFDPTRYNDLTIIEESKNSYTATIKSKTFDIHKFAHDNTVLSILPLPKGEFHNRWSTGAIIEGTFKPIFKSSGIYETFRSTYSGKDQVITVFDTGLDVNNGFFYDPDVEMKYNTINTAHRKVIYYKTYADRTDRDSGHGTHVCGTLAGNASCGSRCVASLYNGVAYNAKISFGDIGYTDRDKDELVRPSNYDIVKQMEESSSSVSLNSWGFETNSTRSSYDELSYIRPEFLHIFSAGNEGKYSSITEPGTSKNVLTVGSVTNLYSLENEYTDNRSASLYVTDENGIVLGTGELANYSKNILRTFKPNITDYYGYYPEIQSDKIVIAKQADVCKTLTNLLNPTAVIIIGENKDQCDTIFDFPVLFTSNLDFPKNRKITISPVTNLSQEYELSSFSSKGPTITGILKPDVVAIGEYVASANAKKSPDPNHGVHNLDLLLAHGTSHAAPMVAGAAAIIQEKYKISHGNAIRAILIASCDPVKGATREMNPESGHGMININNIYTDKYYHLYENQQIKNGQHLVVKFYHDSQYNTDIRICLTYQDVPLSHESLIPLMTDIDITLVTPSKKVIFGNHHKNNENEHFSTAERIVISSTDAESGWHYLNIICKQGYTILPTFFSLYIKYRKYYYNWGYDSYEISMYNATTSNNMPCEHGSYITGETLCTCDPGFTGHNCNVEIHQVNYNANKFFNIPPFSLYRFEAHTPADIATQLSLKETNKRDFTLYIMENEQDPLAKSLDIIISNDEVIYFKQSDFSKSVYFNVLNRNNVSLRFYAKLEKASPTSIPIPTSSIPLPTLSISMKTSFVPKPTSVRTKTNIKTKTHSPSAAEQGNSGDKKSNTSTALTVFLVIGYFIVIFLIVFMIIYYFKNKRSVTLGTFSNDEMNDNLIDTSTL